MVVLDSTKRWQWVFMSFSIFLVYILGLRAWFGFQVFKELVLNWNFMFLLTVVGAAVMKLEFKACLWWFDFFVSSLDSTILGIGNVVCEDKNSVSRGLKS
jgi:hypothetical protein